jgi:vacuolar protein sorting-associated protein 26
MSIFGFGGPPAKVEIELDNSDGAQKIIEVESDDAKEELIIYSGSDNIKGTVKVIIPSGKKLEHVGIKVELIGTIGTFILFLNEWNRILYSFTF